MRVVGGAAKGRRLKAALSISVLRPTSDKVKEAIFDIIGSDIEDSRFLDLFSGTGAIGIEALSRGAKNVTFVDNKSSSIELIKENLERCDFSECFEIVQCDALQAISTLSNRQRKFDIIFLDPPYNSDLALKCLDFLSSGELFTPTTKILLECPAKKSPPERILGLRSKKEYNYGDTIVKVYNCLEARGSL